MGIDNAPQYGIIVTNLGGGPLEIHFNKNVGCRSLKTYENKQDWPGGHVGNGRHVGDRVCSNQE